MQTVKITFIPLWIRGLYSSAATATGNGMDVPGIESLPVGGWGGWGASLFAPVQTGPGAHSASYTMGTDFSRCTKRPERGVDNQPASSAEVKERVELYLYSPSGIHCIFQGKLNSFLLLLYTMTSGLAGCDAVSFGWCCPTSQRNVVHPSKVPWNLVGLCQGWQLAYLRLRLKLGGADPPLTLKAFMPWKRTALRLHLTNSLLLDSLNHEGTRT